VSRAACPSATSTAGARAFRRQNHLQQFVGIFKEISQFVALRSQRLGRQLRGDFDARHRRIFSHVANFIHLNACVPGQRGLQLFRQGRGLGISARKRAHESRELRLR
jgi:hypothetical protein